MEAIDINCDMGEGTGNDAALMPFISSANIACGFHAGDIHTVEQLVVLAKEHNVSIGAHVSFPDRKNFGRSEMHLAENEVYAIVQEQLKLVSGIAQQHDAIMHHVKPHGALYNMSARDATLAKIIAQAIADFDASLRLVGLSGSFSVSEALKTGLKTASEVFADRRYEEDGSLRSRLLEGAMLENTDHAIEQVIQIVKQKTVTTFSGIVVPVQADTICVHGDGTHAVDLACRINQTLKSQSIGIKAF